MAKNYKELNLKLKISFVIFTPLFLLPSTRSSIQKQNALV
ncbi:hypothetical protein DSBG_0053 [Desulfosporosinus sp. BG]|nr:hypothetical protein DSBG_0053 [Desulfosporosinus sp. BG]